MKSTNHFFIFGVFLKQGQCVVGQEAAATRESDPKFHLASPGDFRHWPCPCGLDMPLLSGHSPVLTSPLAVCVRPVPIVGLACLHARLPYTCLLLCGCCLREQAGGPGLLMKDFVLEPNGKKPLH